MVSLKSSIENAAPLDAAMVSSQYKRHDTPVPR
jgi:hypothetical protein